MFTVTLSWPADYDGKISQTVETFDTEQHARSFVVAMADIMGLAKIAEVPSDE